MSYSKVYLMIMPSNMIQSNYQRLYEPATTFTPLQVNNQSSNFTGYAIPLKPKHHQNLRNITNYHHNSVPFLMPGNSIIRNHLNHNWRNSSKYHYQYVY